VDPIAQRFGRPVDYMQGESRSVGKVFHVRAWARMGDRQRVRVLRDLAERYGGDPNMRWFTANTVLRDRAASRDYAAQAAAMLAWVQTNIYYTNEPGEQIQSPWRTLDVKTGDCDDMALLLAAMAESIALPWKFALAGRRGNKSVRWIEGERFPGGVRWSHIYVVLGWPPFAPKQWASAEPTVAGLPLGHDVVLHGVPAHVHGGRDLGDAAVHMHPSFAQRVVSNLEPATLVARGIEAAVVAVIAGWLLGRKWK